MEENTEKSVSEQSSHSSSYGKKPLWHWVAIYLVIGAIIYGLIYYFMFAGKGGGY